MYYNLQFRVRGGVAPADHNYALYSAICHTNPSLKDVDWQLQTINGIPQKNGLIALGSKSKFVIRTNQDNIPLFAGLATQLITLGVHNINIDSLQIQQVIPCNTLHCRIVTIKGYEDIHLFSQAVSRQLAQIGIDASISVRDRITLKIRRFTVVGFSISLLDLSDQASLLLQHQGLGGKRKMGCGTFNP